MANERRLVEAKCLELLDGYAAGNWSADAEVSGWTDRGAQRRIERLITNVIEDPIAAAQARMRDGPLAKIYRRSRCQ